MAAVPGNGSVIPETVFRATKGATASATVPLGTTRSTVGVSIHNGHWLMVSATGGLTVLVSATL